MEKTILENLLLSDNYMRKVIPHLQKDYFSDNDAIIFNMIKKYVEKYSKAPTPSALKIDLESKKLRLETINDCKALIDSFAEKQTAQDEWLVDKTEEFCKDKAIYNAIMRSINIIDGNEKTLEKGVIPELLSDALSVSFDSSVGHDFKDDAEKRYEFYHTETERIQCDLSMLNKITGGGLKRKTLNVILAGTGVGKTFFMCHLASAYMSLGKNVLYITLEISEEGIAERVDANCLNISLEELRKLDKEEYMRRIERMKKKYPGVLKIKEYPSASASSGHFRNLIRELKVKKNFTPDIIIVDYINLCNSARVKKSAQVNSYSYIQSVAQELRGLAQETNVPMITATQTTRAANTADDINIDDVSESFALAHTVDLMVALMSSEDLEAQGQMVVKQLKNRYYDVNKDKRFAIGIDRNKMRCFDVEASVQNTIRGIESSFEKKMKSKKDFSQLTY